MVGVFSGNPFRFGKNAISLNQEELRVLRRSASTRVRVSVRAIRTAGSEIPGMAGGGGGGVVGGCVDSWTVTRKVAERVLS